MNRRHQVIVEPSNGDRTPWLQGWVRCLFCACLWIHVRPLGTEHVTCPECHLDVPDPDVDWVAENAWRGGGR